MGIRMVARMFDCRKIADGERKTFPLSRRGALWKACVGLALCSLLMQTGCVGALAQLLYVVKGHKLKAQFPGLQEKTVAVVCVTDSTAYGPDTLSSTVNKAVSLQLKQNVRKCTVVSPAKVSQWIDSNGWNQSNFVEIGRGVEADMVVAIDLGSYTIKEGQTLYKGRCDLTVTVYDISQGGKVVYSTGATDYTFPPNGRPAIQTTERQFETVYLAKLTDQIARLFYDSDALDKVAEEASVM